MADDPRTKRAKHRSHVSVANAIKRGVLTRPDCCANCGADTKIHAHHEDIGKPLGVTWLCSTCHGKRHAEINKERGPFARFHTRFRKKPTGAPRGDRRKKATDLALDAAHRHAERARQALGRAEMMCEALERHGIPLTLPTTRWAADLRADRQRDFADAERTVAELEAGASLTPVMEDHA